MTACRSVSAPNCRALIRYQRGRERRRKLLAPFLTIWSFRPRIGGLP